MESQQPARIHRTACLGLVILALAAGVPAAGFAATLPETRIVLNSDRYVVGSRWTLDLFVDASDPLSVRVPVPPLPPALVLAEGPYIRETSWEKVPGTLSRATKVSFTFRALQPGIVEIGPFEVRLGSRTVTVNPVTVYLLAADEAKRRFPVELDWVRPEGPFYEGQAIPLMLQARNLDTLAQPQDLGLAAPSGALWEKVVGLGEIEINSIGEDRLMNIPWGGWMLIPTKSGVLTIPAVRAVVSGLQRTVAPLTLQIEPLPAEAFGGRAVGDFAYSVEAKPGESAQEGQLVVVQEISGRGNFPYLEMPEITAPGLTLVSRQEGTGYRATRGGYEGSLVVTWRFASDQTQTLRLVLPGFRAFQPTTGRIDTWDPQPVSVTVGGPKGTTKPAESRGTVLDWAGVQAVRPWMAAQQWWTVLLFLPGPLFLLATFFFPGNRRGLLVLVTLSLVLISATDGPPPGFDQALAAQGSEAADRWASLTGAQPAEPGFWYNRALAAREAGRIAEAVHSFRMALRTGFQGSEAARGLVALEEEELLVDQFQPWTGWPTNLLFLALCLGVNLIFVFWAFQRMTGASPWLVPMAVAVLGTAAAGVFVLSADAARRGPDAVVGLSDGPIRKVPGDLAETWMTLKAGTVVRIQGITDRWVLVQTGYGLEGWVEASGLMLLKEPR